MSISSALFLYLHWTCCFGNAEHAYVPISRCEGCNLQLQAVAYLVKENTGGDAVTAQYAIRSHTWSESAADAMNSSTALYSLLGPGGNQTWDYVILQARRFIHTRCSCKGSEGSCQYCTIKSSLFFSDLFGRHLWLTALWQLRLYVSECFMTVTVLYSVIMSS